jgi:beta-mannanase
LDTADSTPGANDGDRPVKLNERMKYNLGAFQYAQNLPIGADLFPFPDTQIDDTKTDAIAYLTVYPRPTPWNISDVDVEALASQCGRLNNEAKRRVILRFAPEMNGNWNYWGQQPTDYLALWKRVHSAVKAKAPQTDFVWSPNVGTGCKYFCFQFFCL